MKRKLEIVLSPYSGYCFGVKRAMKLIDEGLEEGKKLYTLGDVIHNPQAVERLKNVGVKPIHSLDEVEEDSTLVIRAHGTQPELIEEARRKGINLIDATCPFVQRSQMYVHRLSDESYQVVIIGDRRHPEVQSISAHAGGETIIVASIDDVNELKRLKKAGVVIQTTFSRDRANGIIEALKGKVDDLRVYDTICQATVLRREATMELANNVDLMLIVGGRGSSNTRRLYQMCLDEEIPAKFIETAEEIDPVWFTECRKVGITTGTSTPQWIIDEVIDRMKEISEAPGDEA